MKDWKGRNIEYLRISITDRCNLKCLYCMPKDGVSCLNREDILSYEEICFIAQAFVDLGIKKIKITGGEPLIRENVEELVLRLKKIAGIEEITMTTNGIVFAPIGEKLQAAGLSSVNFSLNTLDPQKYNKISGMGIITDSSDIVRDYNNRHALVMQSIMKAIELNMKTKINCVPIKGLIEDELIEIAELAKKYPLDVRFIELMPIGCGRQFTYIKQKEILKILESKYGKAEELKERHGNGPAFYVNFKGFQGKIGFVSAMSDCFCESCNRIRVTAGGDLKLCLYYDSKISLRELLRSKITREQLTQVLREAVYHKPGKHEFGHTNVADCDDRKMMQIGG